MKEQKKPRTKLSTECSVSYLWSSRDLFEIPSIAFIQLKSYHGSLGVLRLSDRARNKRRPLNGTCPNLQEIFVRCLRTLLSQNHCERSAQRVYLWNDFPSVARGPAVLFERYARNSIEFKL